MILKSKAWISGWPLKVAEEERAVVRDQAPDELETEFRENRIPCTIAEKTVKANQSGHYVKKTRVGFFLPLLHVYFLF